MWYSYYSEKTEKEYIMIEMNKVYEFECPATFGTLSQERGENNERIYYEYY